MLAQSVNHVTLDSIPHPISTPTIFGTIILFEVTQVNPITQPLPAWQSGIILIREFSNAGWLQISSIWLTAHSSIISPYTTAVFLSPIISKTITSVTIICLLVINTIIHYFSTFVTKKLILTANVLNLYQGYQSPLPSAVITPIAPVRAATITEVNTCFVI